MEKLSIEIIEILNKIEKNKNSNKRTNNRKYSELAQIIQTLD